MLYLELSDAENRGKMPEEHLHPHRGWALIRDNGQLTPEEVDHLKSCESCNGWLSKFTNLARESGFTDVKDLLAIAKHGPGENVYLIRFHYLPPGSWPKTTAARRRSEER